MLVLVTMYTALRSTYHDRVPGETFWTYVVLGYVAVNLFTVLVYCLDKGIARENGELETEDDEFRMSRVSESSLLLLEWAGGFVALPVRYAIRHKVRKRRFNRATVVFFLAHVLFWFLWWRVQHLPGDLLVHYVYAYFDLLLLFAAIAPAALCLGSLKSFAGVAAMFAILSASVGINPIPYLKGEIPRSGTKAGQPGLLMPSHDSVENPAIQFTAPE